MMATRSSRCPVMRLNTTEVHDKQTNNCRTIIHVDTGFGFIGLKIVLFFLS